MLSSAVGCFENTTSVPCQGTAKKGDTSPTAAPHPAPPSSGYYFSFPV